MTSTITNYSSLIDTTFPIPGQDNDTAGFRNNSINIQQSLNVAATEITNLQVEQAGIITQLNDATIIGDNFANTIASTVTSLVLNSVVDVVVFPTIALAASSEIPNSYTSITTQGATYVGDGGEARYVLVSNLQVGGFQSADGRYWGLSPNQVITPEMFGAMSTSSTTVDDHNAIQHMITYLGTIGIGSKNCFWAKPYGLGTAGITIPYNGITLSGTVGPTAGEPSPVGTQFIYSGTGCAVSIGQPSEFIFRSGIENISILAVDNATTSNSATGVTLRNGQYCIFRNLGIKNFGAGIGFLDLADGATFYSASCSMYDPAFWGNLYGFRSTTINSAVGTNVFSWFNGFVIGISTSTGINIDLQTNSGQFAFYGTDNESSAILWNVSGQGHRFIGSRSEFGNNHIVLNASSSHNIFVGHCVSTPGGETIYTDNGTDNHYIGSGAGSLSQMLGKFVVQPSADSSEVLNVVTAANLPVFDISTNGTPRAEMPYGRQFTMYSDGYSSATINANGANGALTISGPLQATTGSFSGYVVGTNLVSSSAAVAFGNGYVAIGNTTSTHATTGTASALPSLPQGYLICAVGTSTVKIPYYNV